MSDEIKQILNRYIKTGVVESYEYQLGNDGSYSINIKGGNQSVYKLILDDFNELKIQTFCLLTTLEENGKS